MIRLSDYSVPVSNIQRFSIHDGPGIRTTVFLKGCHLCCAWCHNPETQRQALEVLYTPNNCIGCSACLTSCTAGAHDLNAESNHTFDVHRCSGCMLCVGVCPTGAIDAAGKMMSVQEILDTVLRDKAFYGADGGITLSGGEPLIHNVCLTLLQLSKENGIATAVQTSGFFDMEVTDLERLADLTDVFLWDFKDGNEERHEQYTGKSNDKIIDNLLRLDKMLNKLAKYIILRCIMVKTVNMDADHFSAIAKIFKLLRNCTHIELVPYHALGGGKYKQLGYSDNGRPEWIPSSTDMEAAKRMLQGLGCLEERIIIL